MNLMRKLLGSVINWLEALQSTTPVSCACKKSQTDSEWQTSLLRAFCFSSQSLTPLELLCRYACLEMNLRLIVQIITVRLSLFCIQYRFLSVHINNIYISGGHLVSIHDECENEAVWQMCQDLWTDHYQEIRDSFDEVFVGDAEFNWVENRCYIGVTSGGWTDGSLYDYSPNPNWNPTGDNCGVILNIYGTWAGYGDCGDKDATDDGYYLPVICEIDDNMPTAAPTPACPRYQTYQCETECACKDHEAVPIYQQPKGLGGDTSPLLIIEADNYAIFYGFMMLVFIGLISYPINCVLYYYDKKANQLSVDVECYQK